MNTTERIIAALTPGSMFNRNGKVFRSVKTLAQFAGLEEDEVLDLLNGDLVALVTCKPSTKGKGILVALTEQIPQQEVDGPVNIAAGPVGPGNAPAAAIQELGDAEAPLDDDPIEE